MSGLEYILRQYATYTADQIRIAPIGNILKSYTLRPLSHGLQTRVYHIENEEWVVKEGRWDIEFAVNKHISMPLPSDFLEDVFRYFQTSFLPTPEQIKRQYHWYLQFAQYFGYFRTRRCKTAPRFYSPTCSTLMCKQHDIREQIPSYVAHIEKKYNILIPNRIKEVLSSKLRFHNFLPKEYMLIGKGQRKEHANRLTYYIFQPYIPGPTLHDVSYASISKNAQHQLFLLAFLILLMHDKLNMVPDTRPRYPLTEVFNWLTKTDNVIVSQHGLKFVDTRWLWETKGNFVKRGLFIPEMVVGLSKKLLVYA